MEMGEAAERSGVSVSAVGYYESCGLLPVSRSERSRALLTDQERPLPRRGLAEARARRATRFGILDFHCVP